MCVFACVRVSKSKVVVANVCVCVYTRVTMQAERMHCKPITSLDWSLDNTQVSSGYLSSYVCTIKFVVKSKSKVKVCGGLAFIHVVCMCNRNCRSNSDGLRWTHVSDV